jgi:hypothetical protein
MIVYLFLILISSSLSILSCEEKSYKQHFKPHYSFKKTHRKPLDRSKEIISEHESKKEKTEKSETANNDSYNFIYDKYTASRGEPKMLRIFCNSCDKYIMDYQKDGPGRLLRCYLDRIHKPTTLHERQFEQFSVKNFPALKCPKCSKSIGYPMIYERENRPAYAMVNNRFYFKDL